MYEVERSPDRRQDQALQHYLRVIGRYQLLTKEQEFELSYTVSINARTADGKILIPPEVLSVRRDYVFDRDALIGKSREESVLRIEMRQDAAQQILLRLRAASQR